MIDKIAEFFFQNYNVHRLQQPKKLGQTLNQDKRTYYNKSTPFGQMLQQDKPSLLTTAQLLPDFVELGPKFGQIIQDKPNTTAQATTRLQWS